MDFETEIAKLLHIYEAFKTGPEDNLEANQIAFQEAVAAL